MSKTYALDAILNSAWAMEREALDTMMAIARRENDLEAFRAAHPSAVSVQSGLRLRDTDRVTVRDGIAVVPVVGPIFPRANMFTEVSGGTSVDGLARDLHQAIGNENVRGVLLEVDSPGGQVNGVHELASQIAACRKRKPMGAYVRDVGGSGAYWLASATGDITLSPTARVGSIGVLSAFKPDDGQEIRVVSSQSPRKQASVQTEDGRAEVQQVVDDLASVFVADVARFMGVTEEKVLSDFGRGGVKVGRNAVRAGMAHRTGSFENTLSRMAEACRKPGRGPRAEEMLPVPEGSDSVDLGPAPAAEFVECPECATKPGAPVLCADCLRRRGEWTATVMANTAIPGVAFQPGHTTEFGPSVDPAHIIPTHIRTVEGGVAFEQQLAQALTLVASCITRARSLSTLRVSQGRALPLSEARRRQLSEVSESLSALLQETGPKASRTDALRLKALSERAAVERLLAGA